MEKLFTLLELQRLAQEADSRPALIHVILNETHKLIPYTQAIFWSGDEGRVKLEKASGNLVLDEQSEYGQAVKRNVKGMIARADKDAWLLPLTLSDHGHYGAVVLFKNDVEGLMGGLWLEYSRAYAEAEERILEELAVTYAQSLALWNLRRGGRFFRFSGKAGKARRTALIACAALALLPVRAGITAPAEIVARDAEVVAVPFDGLLEKAEVRPGDAVKKGDVVAKMDHQALKSQMDLAQQDMMIVRAALSQVQRESLSDPAKKMNLTQLQSELEAKKIAFDYARAMHERGDIKAGRDGVAVFADAHALRGRPVATGEKIMMIADPADYELLIRVPVDAMIPVKDDAPVRFAVNVSALGTYKAKIRSIGYQASPDPDGLLTYKIMAEIEDGQKDMRIGWKGTARVKGNWTVLSYMIARRPLIALRNLMGV